MIGTQLPARRMFGQSELWAQPGTSHQSQTLAAYCRDETAFSAMAIVLEVPSGTRLALTLLRRKQFLGRMPGEVVLADLARPAPDLVRHARIRHLVGPLVDQCSGFVSEKFDIDFHLAAAVSVVPGIITENIRLIHSVIKKP